jgi:hypothetical protein
MKTNTRSVQCSQPAATPSRRVRSCQPRLIAAAFAALLLWISLSVNAGAQTVSNDCVRVICPPQLVTNFTCDDVVTPTAYPLIISNKCPGVAVSVFCNPPVGTPLPLGANPVHCVVTANGVVVGVCDFTVLVLKDMTPPVIQCPSNRVVRVCPDPFGLCHAIVNYPPPVAADDTGVVALNCVPAPGSLFPCGVTTVTCAAVDRCNNQAVCTFTVTVEQGGQIPQIDCPPDMVLETCSNGVTVVYPAPAVVPTTTAVTCFPPSGSFMPVGIHAVTCVASNECGSATCTFTVTVRGGHPPVLNCPTTPIVLDLPCGSNCVPVHYPIPAAAGAVVICNPAPGTCLPAGVYGVVCMTSNECGVAACQFSVEIRPTSGNPPGILCPADITIEKCDTNCVVVSYPAPIVTGGVLVGCVPASGMCFPLGVTTVHCAAVNDCATNRCSFNVIVRQSPGPTINCPTNPIIATVPCGTNCVPVFYPVPTTSSGVAAVCNPPSGTCLPVGVYGVVCMLSNDCGVAACQFAIEVRPGQGHPPQIGCPQDITVNTCQTNCVVVTYPAPIATAGAVVQCFPPSGTCFPLGINTVTCRAVNDCGTNFCTFKVIVREGPPPVIHCPTNALVLTVPCNSNCVPVVYPTPAVSGGVIVACTPAPGTCLPVGIHGVVCVATNDCGTSTCQFTIEVRPGQGNPPQITCPADITVTTCSNAAVVNYPAPIVANGILAGCTPPSGSVFPFGVTTVTCTAVNPCGTNTCSFAVIVRNPAPAQIHCPTNAFIVNAPCGSNCVPVFYPLPPVVNGGLVACTPPPGTCLPVGVHVVTCVATNDCGPNPVGTTTSTCQFTIEVRPGQGNVPGIQCPSDIHVTLCSNVTAGGAIVNYSAPIVGGGVFLGCVPPSGSVFPVGLTTVTCTASNACGTNACTFRVGVTIKTPPVIHCPSNINVTAPCNTNCVPVTYPAPAVSSGTLVGCLPPSGSCFPVGTTWVICRASNECGWVACEFPVNVQQGAGNPPSILCPSNIVVSTCSNAAVVFYPVPGSTAGTPVHCTPPSGSAFPVGLTTVVCTTWNACGTNSCSFTVRVVQRPQVSIQCPTNVITVTVPCNTNCVPVFYPMPTAVNGTVVGCYPPSGTCLPVGTTWVICRASNECGWAACEFPVNVVGSTTGGNAPTILCPSNITVSTCANGEFITYPAPVVPGGTNGLTVWCNPPSGSFFPLGTNIVRCCVKDACQQITCCEFKVIVNRGGGCVKAPAGLVLWLPFDEPLPAIAHNIVAGTPNGMHANGVAPILGQYVLNSLNFDGINDFVRVPNYGAINPPNNAAYSMDAWVKQTNNAGKQVIIEKMRQAGIGAVLKKGYSLYLDNGVLKLDLARGGAPVTYNSATVVPAGGWHLVAVTVSYGPLGAVKFYVDGALVASIPTGVEVGTVSNSSSFHVGAGTAPVDRFFRGGIDEVEFFRRELTAAEVQSLWLAGRFGKCKVTAQIPSTITFPNGTNCLTVPVTICNNTPFPMPVVWTAQGGLSFTPPNGVVTVAPFTCVSVPVTVCRTNTAIKIPWSITIQPGTNCPVVTPGVALANNVIVVGHGNGGPVVIAGTNKVSILRLGLNGLPPGQPIRIRAIGPDMEPDLDYVSLNGLPPGQPVIRGGILGEDNSSVDLCVRFVRHQPVGLFTIIIEADLDGDGEWEPISSILALNSVPPPPSLRVAGGQFQWQDEGEGHGVLECADSLDGPWTPVPGGAPGATLDPSAPLKFYRVSIPTE